MTVAMAIVWAIAIGKFVLHLYFNNHYGYFRDEFDYIACGNHLAWGYVDQPPLIPFLTRICLAVFGESLRSVRLIPAVASSLLVVQAAAIAREFGGKFYALLITAIAIALVPQYLSNGSLLGTNCLEPNLWMACAYFVILAIKREDPRYWLWAGVFAGIGMEEKYSIALFVFGIAVGLLLTEQRRAYMSKWFWMGAAAMFLIFLPNLLWNMYYHWPFLQLMHNIRAEHRDVVLGPLQFLLQQFLGIGPFAAAISFVGLFAIFLSSNLRRYRVLGWSYIVCYSVFFFLHGKMYYLTPIYPMLFAAGAVVIESALVRPRVRWLKPVLALLLLLGGLHLAPLVVPVFPPQTFIAYLHTLPVKPPVMEHSHARAILPQWYADQFGWNEIVQETAVAWNEIPLAERHDCAIFAQDYGQAGAIDFLGKKYGLPHAISGDRTYFLWGPRGYSGDCVIVLGDNQQRLQQLFKSVQYVGTSADNPYALETEISVNICRGPKFGTLADLWPEVKRWR